MSVVSEGREGKGETEADTCIPAPRSATHHLCDLGKAAWFSSSVTLSIHGDNDFRSASYCWVSNETLPCALLCMLCQTERKQTVQWPQVCPSLPWWVSMSRCTELLVVAAVILWGVGVGILITRFSLPFSLQWPLIPLFALFQIHDLFSLLQTSIHAYVCIFRNT